MGSLLKRWVVPILLLRLMAEIAAGAANCFPSPPDLIGWWTGDGNALTVVGTNNGALQGGATASAPGEVGPAFSFDGTNGYVQIPDSTALHPTNLTIEAWVQFTGLDSAGSGTSPDGEQYIIFKQNTQSTVSGGFDLGKTRDGASDFFRFIVTSAGGQSTEVHSFTPISVGTWYHVAAVRGGNLLQIYVNGQLEALTDVAFEQDYGTLPLYFGTSGQTSRDHKFQGYLDEVSLYNRALSGDEIAGIYSAGAAGKCKGPSITAQPLSQQLSPGADATFTVAAIPPPLTYQWYFNNSIIPSATNTSLTLAGVQASNSGNYSVVVSNFTGSITSAPATLTVWTPPFISIQPNSAIKTINSTANFVVLAHGAPTPAYQWKFNNSPISGATASSLVIGNVQPADAGVYTVAITNIAGAVTSSPAILTVIQSGDLVTFCDPNLEDAVRAQLGKYGTVVTRQDIRGLTFLRAPESHISCLGGLESATNLSTLQLGGNLISDLSVLTNMPHLTNVALYRNLVTNIVPLASLPGLASVDLRWNPGVRDYGALAQLTNLSCLYLGGNTLGNIASLPLMPKLGMLDLHNNSITNASALAGFTNLTALDLAYNPGLDIESAAGLTNLGSLFLSGNSVTNISFLQKFLQLTNLSLAANSLGDLSTVASLEKLRSLNLDANPMIENFSPLSSLTNLESLSLNNNHLAALDFVQSMGRLASLAADGGGITSAVPISGLSSLSILSLQGNLLKDTSGLSSLTNLIALSLAGNSIANPVLSGQLVSLNLDSNRLAGFDSLVGLSNLDCLSAGGNPVVNISSLASLTNLSRVYLFSAGISNISTLSTLGRLASLDLRNNQISDVSALQTLTNLVWLNISSNGVTGAGSLGALQNLAWLDVSSNSIADWSFAANLTNLNTLAARACTMPDLSFATRLRGLASLDVAWNRITNGSPSSALTNLHYFLAGCNRLRDPFPLSALPRLWRADVRTNLLDLNDPGLTTLITTLTNRGITMDTHPQNQPPSMNIPDRWPVGAGVTSPPLSFVLSDDVTPAALLTINAVSSNPVLIPNSAITFGMTNSNWYVVFAPSSNQSGSSRITIAATDDTGLSTNAVLTLIVVSQSNVTIPDSHLASAIRATINKPSGALNTVDMLKLTSLEADNATIANLSGLEYASNLVSLSLNGNLIASIAPLQGLTKLTSLNLDNNNITDFSPFSALTNLTSLSLQESSITNLSFLPNLGNLTALWLSDNLIVDITPLTMLTNVNSLYLDRNVISNIAPLEDMNGLSYVDLTYNTLNISPGSAPLVVISNLLSRVVTVIYEPQRSPPRIQPPAQWFISPSGSSRAGVGFVGSMPPSPNYTGTASSANEALIPNSGLQFALFPRIGWAIVAAPAPNQSGTTTLTLKITDAAGLTGTASLPVTIMTQSLGAQLFNDPGIAVSTWGDAPWFAETNITHSGKTAAQSGHIADSKQSWLGATLVGPGRLVYWSKVSSEQGYDFLDFSINTILQSNRLSGQLDWQQFVFNIPPGTNALAWSYHKDAGEVAGLDAGWLDEMNFVPGVWLEITSAPTGGHTALLLHGIPNNSYAIEFSTNLINWSQLTVVTPDDDSVPVTDTNTVSATRFYRLHAK